MAAYARAYLDPASPLAVDAITVSPYLGVGSLEPGVRARRPSTTQGVFVLALTSNPEGPQFQLARTADGRPVAQVVVDELAARNADASPLGSFGVVVGATIGAVAVPSCPASTARSSSPASARRAAAPTTCAASSAPATRAVAAQRVPRGVAARARSSGPARRLRATLSAQFAFLRAV